MQHSHVLCERRARLEEVFANDVYRFTLLCVL